MQALRRSGAGMVRFLGSRTAIYALLAVALVAGAGLFGAGWFYAGEIKNSGLVVDHSEPDLDIEVAAVGEGQVTLRLTPDADADGDWRASGIWGLESDSGYDQVGEIIEGGDRQVVRRHIPLSGELAAGDMARLDSYAFPDDPLEARGLPFQEVFFSSPLGSFPAWLVPGSSDTWAIFVHGRGAGRDEALRMLPAVAELGLPCLVVTYRNDEEVTSIGV